jgi:hypothetical protein
MHPELQALAECLVELLVIILQGCKRASQSKAENPANITT